MSRKSVCFCRFVDLTQLAPPSEANDPFFLFPACGTGFVSWVLDSRTLLDILPQYQHFVVYELGGQPNQVSGCFASYISGTQLTLAEDASYRLVASWSSQARVCCSSGFA